MICDFICAEILVPAKGGTKSGETRGRDAEDGRDFTGMLNGSIEARDVQNRRQGRQLTGAAARSDAVDQEPRQEPEPTEPTEPTDQAEVAAAVDESCAEVAGQVAGEAEGAGADPVEDGSAGQVDGGARLLQDAVLVALPGGRPATGGSPETAPQGDGSAAKTGDPDPGVLTGTARDGEVTTGATGGVPAAGDSPSPVVTQAGAQAQAGRDTQSADSGAGGPLPAAPAEGRAVDAQEPGIGDFVAAEQGTGVPVDKAADEAVMTGAQRATRADGDGDGVVPQPGQGRQDGVVSDMDAQVSAVADGQARDPMGQFDGEKNRNLQRSVAQLDRAESMLNARNGDGDGMASAAADRAKGHAENFESLMSRTERFQEFVDRLDSHLLALVSGRDRTMTIGLIPPNLGRLTLNCHESGKEMTIEIVAENRSARALLTQHEDLIRQVVSNNGYRLSGFDVRTQGDGAGARQFARGHGGGSQDTGGGFDGRAPAVTATVEYADRVGPNGIWVVA